MGRRFEFGISGTGQSVELAIPQSLLTPSGGVPPTSINFDVLVNNSAGLPADFATSPEYTITDPSVTPPPPTTIASAITLDGQFSDWPAADVVMTPGNTVPGYQVYGALLNDATLGNTYVIGIDATNSSDPAIGAGTTIYLNTDDNTATGYSPFGSVGAEYEVQFSLASNNQIEPFLYSVTSAGATTLLNGGAPLDYGLSSNGESVELAIPQSLLTPSGGAAPASIEFTSLIDNGEAALPPDFANDPEYVITDPASLVPVNHAIKKVGIVFSSTTEALYYGGGPAGESAYADLFMAAQQQARAAGVSFDLLSESDLTNVAELSQYSALIFPDFQDVQSSQVSAIANALYQVVYQYHVPIITAGDFMTNDQNGDPLPGNSFANMQSLLNLTQTGYGTTTYSVTPDATALASNNPILSGYTAGQLIGGASGEFAGTTQGYYTDTGYVTFGGVTQPATTVADIDIQGGATVPGVVQTTTGGTNTDFATTGLLGDSNLLQHVIQNTVFGTTPSLTLDITRFKGILNSRTDMDQSQFPTDVDPVQYDDQPAGTPGIYDEMIPILQNLYNQYDFVGTYFINVGDDANTANDNFTNWSVSTPYYDDILEMGNEIGTHSYTHLINPPTTTVPETTTTATAAGATQITVSGLPSYNGATLGMDVTDANGDFGPNTIITAVSGNATSGYTLTLSYQPGGYGTPDVGALNAIAAGSTISFAVPNENTNFLSATGTGPFTYNYEFQQSKEIEDSNIGITIAGAAVPGANDYLPNSENILSYFPSTADGLTGYVSGGWTGVGSGSPNAIGYLTPSDTGSVYIAPNITFDFSELQYEDKTPASSEAAWESLFNQLSTNSATPIIVWPWHDYGITDWPTDGVGTTPPGYSEAMYQDFIAYAYNAGYEFVTSEDLAARVAAEQAATLSETTSGNVITATVTPNAAEPDLGAMALNVTNGAVGQVIQNAGSWYAYNTTSVFLADDAAANAAPETFTVTLGTAQDDVTHVNSLPMRADLQSVTGDGSNLTLSMTGDGTVDFHIKTPGAGSNIISIQTSAVGTGAGVPTAILNGDDLELVFNDGQLAISSASPQGVPVLHDVTITEGATAVAGATFVFAAPTVAITSAGAVTNQSTQTISGTVMEPTESQVVGTTVTLYDNGSTTPLGTAVVQAGVAGVNGGLPTWTATVTLTGDGAHSIVASDTDLSNLTGSSTAVVYTLATQPPTVSASETISGVTNTTSDTITVTAAAEAVGSDSVTGVEIYNGATSLGAATLSGGVWSYTASALIDGTYAFSAVATDAAGNTGSAALASLTVATKAPIVTISGTGGPTNAATQPLSGTVALAATGEAAVGSMVTLYDNGVQVGTTTETAGSWSTTVTLSSGANSIVAQDTDAAGNTGSSSPVTFTLTSGVTVAYFLANRTALDAIAGGFTIQDTSANILANLKGVATDPLNADTHITSIALSDLPATLALTIAQATIDTTALGKIATPPAFTVADTAAHIQALTAAQITLLTGLHITQVSATDTSVALKESQLQSLETAGIHISVPSGLKVTLTDTSPNLALLSATLIAGLPALGVTSIISSNGSVSMNLGQALALETASLKVVNSAGANAIHATDTAANVAALTPAQITALPAAGVASLAATNASVTLSLAQALALEGINLKIGVPTGNSLSAADTAEDLSGFSATAIAALPGIGITAINVTDAIDVIFTVAQVLALEKGKITLTLQSGTNAILADTAANIATLTTAQVAGLAALHITEILATDTTVNLTVAAVLALESAGSTAGSAAAIYDTSAHIQALTVAQINGLLAVGVMSLVSTNSGLKLSVTQVTALEANDLTVKPAAGTTATVSDTGPNIATLTPTRSACSPTAGFSGLSLTNGAAAVSAAQVEALETAGFKVALSGGSKITISDLAANIAGITAAQLAALSATGVSAIAATDMGVAFSLAQAIALESPLIKVTAPTGFVVSASGTAAAILALTPAQITGLKSIGVTALSSSDASVALTVAQAAALKTAGLALSPPTGGTDSIVDTAANIQGLTAAQIASLTALHITQVTASNAGLALKAAQVQALQSAGIKVSTPTGSTVTVTDSSPNLGAMTAAFIAGLPAFGITAIVSSNGSVPMNLAQVLALETAALKVTNTAGATAIHATDTAATIAALSPAQITALLSAGVASLAATNASVVLTLAQALALEGVKLKLGVPGGDSVSVADTAANVSSFGPTAIAALSATGVTAISVTDANNVTMNVADVQALETGKISLSAQSGHFVAISDTAADIAGLTAAQIAGLSALHVTRITATDTTVPLAVAQATALETAAIAVAAPSGSPVTVSDTAAHLQALTAAQITALTAIGVSSLASTNASVTYNAAQTSAILAANLGVSASGTNSVSETFTNNSVISSASNGTGGGSLTLSTNSNGVTVNAGPSALSVTSGSQTIAVKPSPAELITATGRTNDMFTFAPGFGQDSITGFLGGTGSTHDLLQFNASALGAGLTSANQTADLVALLSDTTNNSAGSAVISDMNGDTLTLNGVSKATLSLAANAVDFKFV